MTSVLEKFALRYADGSFLTLVIIEFGKVTVETTEKLEDAKLFGKESDFDWHLQQRDGGKVVKVVVTLSID